MVRIKHRYILINVLYPHDASKSASASAKEAIAWTVQFRRPSSDRLDGKLVQRLIRDGVSELFGDYGAGMIAGSLQGKAYIQQGCYRRLYLSTDRLQSNTALQQLRPPSYAFLGLIIGSCGLLCLLPQGCQSPLTSHASFR